MVFSKLYYVNKLKAVIPRRVRSEIRKVKEIKVEIDGTEIIIKTPKGRFVRPLNEKLMEFGPYLWMDTKGHLYREVSSPYSEDQDK